MYHEQFLRQMDQRLQISIQKDTQGEDIMADKILRI